MQVPGRIGMTLYDVAKMHGIDLGPSSVGGDEFRKNSEEWTEDLYGEGPNSAFDHVMIPGQWKELVGTRTEMEDMMFHQQWEEDEIKDSSRLASMVTLKEGMEGMTVYIPDGLPADCP